MGTMTFQLPAGLSGEAARNLESACVACGTENMPYPTAFRRHGNLVGLNRTIDESGYLMVPWAVEGVGQMMCSSSTLMERSRPYNLLVELARGKANQVRNQ